MEKEMQILDKNVTEKIAAMSKFTTEFVMGKMSKNWNLIYNLNY